jgi:hypothetical protein
MQAPSVKTIGSKSKSGEQNYNIPFSVDFSALPLNQYPSVSSLANMPVGAQCFFTEYDIEPSAIQGNVQLPAMKSLEFSIDCNPDGRVFVPLGRFAIIINDTQFIKIFAPAMPAVQTAGQNGCVLSGCISIITNPTSKIRLLKFSDVGAGGSGFVQGIGFFNLLSIDRNSYVDNSSGFIGPSPFVCSGTV